MKKALIYLLCFVFLTCLVFIGIGCKQEETAAAETTAAETTAAETTAAGTTAAEFDAVSAAIENFKSGGAQFESNPGGKYKIGISMCLFDQPYWIGMYAGFLQGGMDFDANIVMQNANLDITRQMANFQDYITQKKDGLIIVPTDTDATSAVIKIANDAGVPVVEANRVTSSGEYTAIMYDNYECGALSAQAMKDAADKLGFKEINALELVGDLKIAIGAERHDGFNDKAKEFENFKVVGQMPTEWLSENVYPAAMDGFSAHPEANAVYLSSDLMTQPLLSALDALGKLIPAGQEGHIIVVTIDGQPIACKNIREGFVDASMNNECFEIGYKSVENIVKMIKGEKIDPKITLLPLMAITKDNVDDPKLWGNALAGVVQ